jgi:pSer/pThr/pTyr-binding forkhead associated (FHA) protein
VALGPISLSTRQIEGDNPRGGTDQLGTENVVILQVENDASPMVVQIREDIILGRTSESSDVTTHINLTDYDAEEMGVSRRHARLVRDHKAVYLMDLKSTNGTRLNGEPLSPSVEKRLRDGDEIMLGRLRIYIFFKT